MARVLEQLLHLRFIHGFADGQIDGCTGLEVNAVMQEVHTGGDGGDDQHHQTYQSNQNGADKKQVAVLDKIVMDFRVHGFPTPLHRNMRVF
ncbi:hypothetical protein D3C81_1985140 [compost metagenome]